MCAGATQGNGTWYYHSVTAKEVTQQGRPAGDARLTADIGLWDAPGGLY